MELVAMTNKKALIRQLDGQVVNVIIYDDKADWQPPEGCTVLDALDASPGDTWDGNKFIHPTPEVVALDPDIAAFIAGTVAQKLAILARRVGL